MHSIGDSDFKSEVLDSPLPVLVDFWAPWCAPCRALAPVLDEIDVEFRGRLKVAKVNVDENQGIAGQLGVRSIPTLVVFKDGQPVDGVVGGLAKKDLVALVTKHLEAAPAA
jgi:thioredoxin 1